MDAEELGSHREAPRLVKKNINFGTKNAAGSSMRMTSRISMCYILN
jgi:hypothetical protein